MKSDGRLHQGEPPISDAPLGRRCKSSRCCASAAVHVRQDDAGTGCSCPIIHVRPHPLSARKKHALARLPAITRTASFLRSFEKRLGTMAALRCTGLLHGARPRARKEWPWHQLHSTMQAAPSRAPCCHRSLIKPDAAATPPPATPPAASGRPTTCRMTQPSWRCSCWSMWSTPSHAATSRRPSPNLSIMHLAPLCLPCRRLCAPRGGQWCASPCLPTQRLATRAEWASAARSLGAVSARGAASPVVRRSRPAVCGGVRRTHAAAGGGPRLPPRCHHG